LQLASSALDRVNVRRLVIEIKRIISGIANRMLFEQNNASTRSKFVGAATPQLALIQAQQGIERFSITMDETNNTQFDVESNRVNGRIVIVPTRTIEFIAIDFAITSSGISFE
jgi:phage tail sheath protein FI